MTTARALGLALSLALLLLLLPRAEAAASRHFSQAAEFSAFLHAAQNADGSFGDGSLRDSARAAAALAHLAEPVPRAQALCSLAEAALAAASPAPERLHAAAAEELHAAALLLEALDCGAAPPAAAAPALRALLAQEGATVAQLHAAAAAALALQRRGLAFPLAALEPLVEALEERVQPDGSVADADGAGSLLAAGLAFQTAGLVDGALRLDEELRDLVAVLAEHADGLLQAYSELPAGVAYLDGGDSRSAPRVTTELLRGALALQQAGGFDFDAAFVAELADFFCAPAAPLDLERVHYTLAGLHLLAGSALPAPVAVQLLQPALSTAAAAPLLVRVADLFGAPLGELRVFVLSATAVASGRVAASNQLLQLAAGSETDYEFALLAARPEPGYYLLDLAVRAADGAALVASAPRTAKVLARVAVDGLRLEVLDSADREVAQEFRLEAGAALPAGVATNYYYSLAFSFQVSAAGRPVAVQQALVRLQGPGGEASFAAVAHGKGLRALVDLRAAAAALRFRSGLYAAQLIVGDAFVENPLLWELGEVALEFPPRAAAAALPHQAQPEIAHTFRAPERRPMAFLSLAYAAATAAPWAILLLGIPLVGLDVQVPAAFPFAMVFLASLAGIFLLYGWFFLAINMFQTLAYLGGLGLVAVVAGNRALRARAEQRLAAKQKAD